MLMVSINFLLPLAPRPLRGGGPGLGGWVRACGSRWAETQPQGAGMRALGSLLGAGQRLGRGEGLLRSERMVHNMENGGNSPTRQQEDLNVDRRVFWKQRKVSQQPQTHSYCTPLPSPTLWSVPQMLEEQDGLPTLGPALTIPRVGGLGTEGQDGLVSPETPQGPSPGIGCSCQSRGVGMSWGGPVGSREGEGVREMEEALGGRGTGAEKRVAVVDV